MSQNPQNIENKSNRGKQPTDLRSSDFAGFDNFVRKRMNKKIFVLLLISLVLIAASCKTKEVPGRRRTPRRCNSCTKWSHAPQETIEYELLHHDEA